MSTVEKDNSKIELPKMLNDLLSKAKAEELSDELGSLMDSIKVLGWKEMRPWSEFSAVFKPPQFTSKYIEQRMVTNMLYYRTNYLMIILAICIIKIIFSPSLLITLILCSAFTFYAKYMLKAPIKAGEVVINEDQKNVGIIGINVLTLLIMGALVEICWMFLYSFIICILHMTMRPRNVGSKTNKTYEELKLSTGLYSMFGIGGQLNGDASNKESSRDPENPTNDEPSEPTLNGYPNTESMRKRANK